MCTILQSLVTYATIFTSVARSKSAIMISISSDLKVKQININAVYCVWYCVWYYTQVLCVVLCVCCIVCGIVCCIVCGTVCCIVCRIVCGTVCCIVCGTVCGIVCCIVCGIVCSIVCVWYCVWYCVLYCEWNSTCRVLHPHIQAMKKLTLLLLFHRIVVYIQIVQTARNPKL